MIASSTLWGKVSSRCSLFWRLIWQWFSNVTHGLSRFVQAPQEQQVRQQPEVACTKRPLEITYVPIPGPWRRVEKPNWPDSAFEIPAEVPEGTIYYITKGSFVGQGSTAHIELLPSGHIVKYPKSNPYCAEVDEENRKRMCREAEAYKRLNGNIYIPKFIDWDPNSCCLTLEHMKNGSLHSYISDRVEIIDGARVVRHIPIVLQRQWAEQAAEALAIVHAAGIIHCDLTPSNFLLNEQFVLHLSDFAGCSISGSTPLIAPGPRYQPAHWHWKQEAKQEDDVFALGSVLYFIIAGSEPYTDLEEEEVRRLFHKAQYPQTDHLPGGAVMQGCWDGTFSTAQEALGALHSQVW